MRILLVGVGARGRMWARILRELGAEIAAFVDPSTEAQAWARETSPQVQCYADIEEALGREQAQTAVVVTPPMGRSDIILPLLEAGLHVISEKPLAGDLADAARIVDAAERAGRQLSVCMNFRYLPVTEALKGYLDGRWGPVAMGVFLYFINRDGRRPGINRFPLEMDDPMLLEQSVHHFDLIRFVYDAEILQVRSQIFNPSGSMYRGDATVAALLELERGIRVTYLGSWVTGSNIRSFYWRTDCVDGVAIQSELFGGLEAGPRGGPLRSIAAEAVEPFVTDTRRYARAVLQALADGAPVPCTGRDHLRALAATIACRRAWDRRRSVSPSELLSEVAAGFPAAEREGGTLARTSRSRGSAAESRSPSA